MDMAAPRLLVTALLTVAVGVPTGAAVIAAPPASAASTDVVINEMMFHAASDLDGDDYLELTNIGATAVDLSGWTIDKGVTATFPAGATIAPGGFYVLANDATQFQATYHRAANLVYTGNLSNGGETVNLKDSGGNVIDSVKYSDHDPWPTTTDGTGPSLELIDPTQNNDDYLNWAASTSTTGGTPGAPNSVRRVGLGPRVTGMTPSTTAPAANTPLTVTATISADQTQRQPAVPHRLQRRADRSHDRQR